ncbi:MAG: rhodanese-like domain-containing protein [Chlorobi bacterium]|nr:MAG: rhodanese-like domain-containing protein [Bacteroidota bacterium]KXK34059.1 MAG: rhodanese-related sulfurtransferase [Chlorobi bacterium OLB6]MBE2265139.1 rhodanese-like domain-containing protein [Flavobacteriales bacterium]MBL1161344.1 rhodanese-like domain-containing protein [Chlorobiota bacterium]MBW7852631.1 rhodanese-like domain-containing protein [Candidatus Kapabacteria bacterium]MCC6331109.1 rhodanese-like domain-containing protein [Ignavibacteria bacterium]
MGILSRLFGGGSSNLTDVLNRNPIIIDVRTSDEFRMGHIQGCKNMPLQQLDTKIASVPKDKPIVFCCASGARSGAATRLARSLGYEAVNGGSWVSVQNQLGK